MCGLLITRPPLQWTRTLTLTFFLFQREKERFGAFARDPLDSKQTRVLDEFPLPARSARSGERIKVRGMSNGIPAIEIIKIIGLGPSPRRVAVGTGLAERGSDGRLQPTA